MVTTRRCPPATAPTHHAHLGTGYFQRLRPYPRVLLRRLSARFKDYDKTPIGFGIAVFCIAREDVRWALPPFLLLFTRTDPLRRALLCCARCSAAPSAAVSPASCPLAPAKT